MLTYISFLLTLLFILLSIAFYTLFERKILSLTQTRIGPNKVSFKGLLQPVLDGVKLFSKEFLLINKSMGLLFVFGPMIAFMVMILFWHSMYSLYMWNNAKMNVLFVLSCIGVLVYSTMLSGWSSFSKFGFIGAIRSCSQTISYEISLSLLMIFFLLPIASFSLWNISNNLLILFLLPINFMWCLSLVSETNRAPFDFSEGESELISGFNIEYSSTGFVLLFLAEYGMMILFCYFTTMIFFKKNMIFFFILLYLFIVIRSTFPRYRYDKLMQLMWMKILPIVCLFYFVFYWLM